MRLIDPVSGKVVVVADEARGPLRRMRGLIGRAAPNPGAGTILRGKQVHTLGMKYAIDAIYMTRDGSVLRVQRLSPWRIGPFEPRARWVLELAAQEADRLGISSGTVLAIEP